MAKKRLVIAIGHKDLGTNLPEQKAAVEKTSKVIADFIQEGWQTALVHSNAPQVGMIHTAMNEFSKLHNGYSHAPMSVCSAMSQGYIGYDLQNGLRCELVRRGIYKPVSTILTQVTVDPYDEAFYTPVKVIGRILNAEEAAEEESKGNHVTEIPGAGWRSAGDRLRRRRHSGFGAGEPSKGCQRSYRKRSGQRSPCQGSGR